MLKVVVIVVVAVVAIFTTIISVFTLLFVPNIFDYVFKLIIMVLCIYCWCIITLCLNNVKYHFIYILHTTYYTVYIVIFHMMHFYYVLSRIYSKLYLICYIS